MKLPKNSVQNQYIMDDFRVLKHDEVDDVIKEKRGPTGPASF